MKKSQKKYAQLVEAQSPEPAELIEGHSIVGQILLPALGNGRGCGKCESGAVSPVADHSRPGEDPSSNDQSLLSSGAGTLGGEQTLVSATINTAFKTNKKMANKKQARDRQVGSGSTANIRTDREFDTSKVSQCSSQISTSFISTGSQVSSPSECSSSTSFVTTNQPLQSPSASPRSSGRGTNLTRTISRSLLQLDDTIRPGSKFEVSWQNLTFNYRPSFLAKLGKKSTRVLRNISGGFRSNQLIAIIGPSGCGKTTLLQLLAGIHPANLDRLRISGLEEPKVAFIGQGDCLLPGLSARETLIYASRLQNTKPNFDHERHIEPILNELGLTECADRSVTKLSGGQAKRVTIAQELLYPTNVLILDELTSGLDASTSYSIVKMLKQLVSNQDYPMSIVMSIHQPSAKLFSVFDKVYVMSEGCCLYEGSCRLDSINSHLRRFGIECPQFNNMADFLIEIASEDLNSSSNDNKSIRGRMIEFEQSRNRALVDGDRKENLHCGTRAMDHEEDDFKLSSVVVANTQSLFGSDDVMEEDDDEDQDKSRKTMIAINSGDRSLYKAIERARGKRERPIYQQIQVHFRRSFLRIGRSNILTYLQMITYVLSGLLLATFFGGDVGQVSGCPGVPMSFIAFIFADQTEANLTSEIHRIQGNINFLLVSMMIVTFAALEITVITFPLEAKTVKREWRNGWYRVSSYSIGRTLADLPFQVVFVCIYCFIIYTLTGQVGLTNWRFASFVLIMIMSALIAQTVGFIFGAIFMENLPAAVFIAPLCIFPSLLFSGFFSRVSQIPDFYRPVTYMSHFRYVFNSFIVTLYGFDRCSCDEESLVAYHASQGNQSGTVRDMFKSLFGSSDCASANPEENSIEDAMSTTTDMPSIFHNLKSDNNSIPPFLVSSSTAMPLKSVSNTLEDTLVDKMFEQMRGVSTNDSTSAILSTTESTGGGGTSAMDHLVHNFSHRITQMLNQQSNFGHEVPATCRDSKSHLMAEFDLTNDDLMFGIVTLLVFVIVSRLLCNIILSFTIASRAT